MKTFSVDAVVMFDRMLARHEQRLRARSEGPEEGQLIIGRDPMFDEISMDISILGLIGFASTQRAYSEVGIPAISRKRQDVSTLLGVVERLQVELKKECNEYLFLKIDKAREKDIDNPKPFGEAVSNAFPSATFDLTQAGNCLAIGCNTAAVFHFMRAVEHAMRVIAIGVGITAPKIPLAYQDWQNVIEKIELEAASAVDLWGKSVEQINARQFFSRIVADLMSFKNDVRNVTMHTRKNYNEPEAIGVRIRVGEWFQIAADKISENNAPGSLLVRSLFAP